MFHLHICKRMLRNLNENCIFKWCLYKQEQLNHHISSTRTLQRSIVFFVCVLFLRRIITVSSTNFIWNSNRILLSIIIFHRAIYFVWKHKMKQNYVRWINKILINSKLTVLWVEKYSIFYSLFMFNVRSSIWFAIYYNSFLMLKFNYNR